MRRTKIIILATSVVIALPAGVASAHSDKESSDFVDPPVNPLPSLFDVSSNGNNEVPDIPPPINPLPAKEVYVQSSKTTYSISSTKFTPKNTQTAKTRKPKTKTKTITKHNASKDNKSHAGKTTAKKKTPQHKHSRPNPSHHSPSLNPAPQTHKQTQPQPEVAQKP